MRFWRFLCSFDRVVLEATQVADDRSVVKEETERELPALLHREKDWRSSESKWDADDEWSSAGTCTAICRRFSMMRFESWIVLSRSVRSKTLNSILLSRLQVFGFSIASTFLSSPSNNHRKLQRSSFSRKPKVVNVWTLLRSQKCRVLLSGQFDFPSSVVGQNCHLAFTRAEQSHLPGSFPLSATRPLRQIGKGI